MYLLFFRLGWLEILLIVAVLILVFGTSRFGQLKNSFVKAVGNFQRSAKGETKE